MSGKGKVGKSKKMSSASKAGLQFPPARMKRYMKRHGLARRISPKAGVAMAAALEYLAAEVLELAGNATTDNKKVRVNPRHIFLAVKNDEELAHMLPAVISTGGVVPNIHFALLKKKKPEKEGAKKK